MPCQGALPGSVSPQLGRGGAVTAPLAASRIPEVGKRGHGGRCVEAGARDLAGDIERGGCDYETPLSSHPVPPNEKGRGSGVAALTLGVALSLQEGHLPALSHGVGTSLLSLELVEVPDLGAAGPGRCQWGLGYPPVPPSEGTG